MDLDCSERVAGSLEHGTVSRILSQLATQRLSGKLRIASHGHETVLVVSAGAIAGYWTTCPRNPLGQILLQHGRITGKALSDALALQRSTSPRQRLGLLLEASGSAQEKDVQNALRIQLRDVVQRLLALRDGEFSFEAHAKSSSSWRSTPLRELLSSLPDSEGSSMVGQSSYAKEVQLVPARTVRLSEFYQLSHSLRTAPDLQEVVWSALHFLRCFVDRSALLFCSARGLRSYAHYILGETEVVFDDGKFLIPLESGSVFYDAMYTRRAVRRHQTRMTEKRLAEQLGVTKPKELIAQPLMVNNEPFMIVYGDVVVNARIDDLDVLEEGVRVCASTLERVLATGPQALPENPHGGPSWYSTFASRRNKQLGARSA